MLKHGSGQRVYKHTRQGELRGHDARARRQAEAQARQARRQGRGPARILRSGVFSFAPGAHSASLKLSRATAAKLRDAGKPVVLTVQMTLTDVYGRKAGRSVKLTVTR